MTAAIEIRNISRSYGRHRVLDELSLSVEGGIFALLGQNGAGKTTLIDILTTLSTPDSGRASIHGLDLVRDRARIRQLISATGQYAAVDEMLTGTENLRLFARLLGLSHRQARERSEALLHRFALSDAANKAVRHYSGGMRRRLDLATSLIVTPRVLFLDEPTTGLDPMSRQGLWQQVRELAAEGTTVFLTTQYLEEADALADRIAILAGGRIVAEGSAAELKARVGDEYLELVDEHGSIVHSAPSTGSARDIAAALSSLDPAQLGLRLELRRPTLDDAFTALTGSPPPVSESESEDHDTAGVHA